MPSIKSAGSTHSHNTTALPGGSDFPIEIIVAAAAEPAEILDYVEQIKEQAIASGRFAFPPIIDTRIDQPETQFIIDRDLVSEMGLTQIKLALIWQALLAAAMSIASAWMDAAIK